MNVGDICVHNVATVLEHDELTTAARMMREQHVGFLVVVMQKVGETGLLPIGVITDRDIVVSVVAQATDPASLHVGDLMARHPVVVEESAPLSKALQEMRRTGVRRLPVVDREGLLVGILSLDDVLGTLSDELLDVAAATRTEVRMEKALRA
jgi:CBS domain-containing protein